MEFILDAKPIKPPANPEDLDNDDTQFWCSRLNQAPQTPPVKPGDEIDVRIESVGEKGDGVAKKQGFVIFVPRGKKDEEVHIKITKVLTSVAFSENLGAARGPIANPVREFRERPKYQQPVRKEEVDLSSVGEGSEEF